MASKTIWKFEVPVEDDASVLMPRGAVVLDVKAKYSSALEVWAIVDPDEDREPRRFSIRGTGHPLGQVGKHLATVRSNALVWHVFEGGPQA